MEVETVSINVEGLFVDVEEKKIEVVEVGVVLVKATAEAMEGQHRYTRQ